MKRPIDQSAYSTIRFSLSVFFVGYGIGSVVAAGHGAHEERSVSGHAVAMFNHVVEEHVVGHSPGAEYFVLGVAVLSHHPFETVLEEEATHVVIVFVVGHEIGGAVSRIP